MRGVGAGREGGVAGADASTVAASPSIDSSVEGETSNAYGSVESRRSGRVVVCIVGICAVGICAVGTCPFVVNAAVGSSSRPS